MWTVGSVVISGFTVIVVGFVCFWVGLMLSRGQLVSARHALKLAHHDKLTGLPDRTLADETLQTVQLLHQTRTVGIADINGLKLINDEQGHDAGDRAIVSVSEYIVAMLPKGSTVARLGGDEFLIVSHADVDEVQRLFSLNGGNLLVSIGLSLTDSTDVGNARRRADIAMYQAKTDGVPVKVYHIDMGNKLPHKTRAPLPKAVRPFSTQVQEA